MVWPTSFWDKIWTKIRKSSRAASTTQTLFFIYNRLLLSLVTLHKRFPNTPDMCWMCLVPQANLFHMLFLCPRVHIFWRQVWSQINLIFDTNFPFSFLHIFLGSLSSICENNELNVKVIDLLMAIAFQQITSNWKDFTKISYKAWWYAVCHNHRLDTTFVYPLCLAVKHLDLWSLVMLYIDACAKTNFKHLPSQQEVLKPP